MDQHDVYICHCASSTNPIAQAIAYHLEDRGISCWYAPRNLDVAHYADSVVSAIDSCRLFLIILDAAANESADMMKELHFAIERERKGEDVRILPLQIDESTLSSRYLYFLSVYHFFHFAASTIERDIQHLVDNVERLLNEQNERVRQGIANRRAVIKPYSGDESYAFVSYSHRNTEKVLPIISELQQLGYRVWYDEGIDPGTEWDDYIAERIETCSCLIAFVSTEYLASENCKDELNFARDLEKKRLLVYLEDVALPRGMAMRLNRIQAIHSYTYNTKEDFVKKLTSADSLADCC